MSGMERDVEKGNVDDAGSLAPGDVEKTSQCYQKAEGSVGEENLNLVDSSGGHPGATDEKIVQIDMAADKVALQMQADSVAAGASTVPVVSDTPKSSDLERVAENSGTGEGSSTEQQAAAPQSPSTGESLTECEVASRIARAAAENAREAAHACRRMVEVIGNSTGAIQRHVDDFHAKARDNPAQRNIYVALAEKYESAIRVLRKKAGKLGAVATAVEQVAFTADRNAAYVAAVTDEELPESKLVKLAACQATDIADSACIVAHKTEHSALRSMKEIWTDIRDDASREEDADSSVAANDEYASARCENRDRKTRMANVAALVCGIAFMAALALFTPGSDSFYAILCLAVLTMGWSVAYWGYEIYLCVKERRAAASAPESPAEFLARIEERLAYLQDYLERNNASPLPSDSDSDL